MYASKDYQNSGAGQLLSYISREQHDLRDRSGNWMTGEDVDEFIECSEQHEYEEHWVLSPDHGDRLSDDELSLAARKTMSEHVADRPTATYCYAIHRDTEHPHVQVAVTGEKHDLWTEQQDLDRVRERAREHTREREYQHERARERKRDRERERQRRREHEREQERERDRDRSRGREW
jgi:hypothetical protein